MNFKFKNVFLQLKTFLVGKEVPMAQFIIFSIGNKYYYAIQFQYECFRGFLNNKDKFLCINWL